MPDEATVRRRQLGRELRMARTAAGLTQASVATVLGCGQGKINKIETTLVAVSIDELDTMLELYALPEDKAEALRELAIEDLRNPHRRGVLSDAFEQLSDRELDAKVILSWHSERIPGPLQSEHYMLQQFRAETETPEDVVQLTRRRQARTRVFTTDNPPDFQVILSESSLHRMPGGRSPELVVDQVEHLLQLIDRYERFTLRILTFDASIQFVDSDFVLLRFAGIEDDFAYIEFPGGARLIRSKELAKFEEHWSQLRDAALGRDESIRFMMELVEEQRRKWDTTDGD